ncbi:hypothetical protein SO694_00194030 [Aureococcus anophagefferens]|uniref:EF-hand domain-containing protein n=1 Tax=Aureococcus anophagefferens TaxID=44056 RepID=A0ABR1FNV0_AURAN
MAASAQSTSGDLAKAKLEELFTAWLSLEETANRVDHWLELGGRGELEAPGEASSLSAPAASHPRQPPSSPLENAEPRRPDDSEKAPPFEAFASPRREGDASPAASPPPSRPAPAAALAPLLSKRRLREQDGALARAMADRWDRATHGDETMPAASFAAFSAECADLPSVCGALMARACCERLDGGGASPALVVRKTAWLAYWRERVACEHDPRLRLFAVLAKRGAHSVDAEDWAPLLDTLIAHHPGLKFLEEHVEFQRKYAATVTARLYYRVNLSRTGKISRRELLRPSTPCVLQALVQLDGDPDINKELSYFSYEHFYVLYCRFWELDGDHDARLSRDDVLKYGGHRLSRAIVDRVFGGAAPYGDGRRGDFAPPRRGAPARRPRRPRRGARSRTSRATTTARPTTARPSATTRPGRPAQRRRAAAAAAAAAPSPARDADALTYADFVYFMLSEEDKSTEAAMRYWFQCVDVDGDGVVDVRDAAFFYDMQARRMECLGHDVIGFEDVLCQMADLLTPASLEKTNVDGSGGKLWLTLDDVLRKTRVAGVFFDALFSLDKFVAFEQRDPFADRLKRDDPFDTDWDRFAAAEYARLATEDDAHDDDLDEDDDDLGPDDLDHDDDQRPGPDRRANEAPF